ncbi:MAG: polyribonucleotide nucleotidyltransferase [Candidatus Izemoplasmataceae bacterium]
MQEPKTYELDLNGRKLVVEIGELAKQATAAALIRYNDTGVLSVMQTSGEQSDLPFFPLLVNYTEKLYAAGKIPGGFLKREGRPSDHETLTARLIDRPLRPLFPDGFRHEVQVINTVMSGNTDYSPPMAAMFGSSLTISMSSLPFAGPIAGVVVGRIDGEFILNPTEEELTYSDIDLTVAGTKHAINMVEAGAKQVDEDVMLDAIIFAHEWIKKLVEFQEEIVADIGEEKMTFEAEKPSEDFVSFVEDNFKDRVVEAVRTFDREKRGELISVLKDEIDAKVPSLYPDTPEDEQKAIISTMKELLDNHVKNEVRRSIIEDKKRPDGRGLDEIRPLSSRIDLFAQTHGSALFTRGQTQALSVTTLGALGEHQIIDGLGDQDNKRFMLHYNFPPYSVGEVGRYGPPKRREIGHGALGERALWQVLPDEEDFPYTIRIVSEILESNGSTSQASICAGCMSLMAAGVPIKAPVAGIAMGLIKEGDDYRVLTDIQGLEDHLGDMDFKVAGSKDGITALQMDIKIEGLSKDMLKEALEQARKGRLEILDHMLKTIPEARPEVAENAPKVKIMLIDPEKIRDVIGPGGKQISKIVENNDDVKIDIEQDGRVTIMHTRMEPINNALKEIEDIVRVAKVGERYQGKVVRVENYGCFVELWPGTDGLCHISKLAHGRVEKVTDVVNVGDTLDVKVIGIDDRGRIDLSHKAVLPKPDQQKGAPKRSSKDSKPSKK